MARRSGPPTTMACSPISSWASLPRPRAKHVEGRHRSREAAQRQLAERLGLDEALDRGVEAARDEDLAAARLAAEPRGEVGHGADRAIVPAALEADGAERRVALRDAHAEVQVEAELAPAAGQRLHARAHGEGHPQGAR